MISWACRLVGAAALLAFALSAAAHAAAIAQVDIEARYPIVWWLQGVSIVLVPLAVVSALRGAGTGERLRGVIVMLPVWARVVCGAAFVYALANMIWLAPASGAGDPVVTGDGYFFNDHGVMRKVSTAAFHAQRAASVRLYSATWMFLNLTAALLLLLARKPARPVPSRAAAV